LHFLYIIYHKNKEHWTSGYDIFDIDEVVPLIDNDSTVITFLCGKKEWPNIELINKGCVEVFFSIYNDRKCTM
jgi:hypothetical protein